MPNRIRLEGFVGQDLTAAMVSEKLDALDGGELTVDLYTEGGIVYDGIEIYNRIAQYPGKKTVVMGGLVASIGTYIATAFDDVVAQESTVYMIHNGQGFVVGDYRAMAKEAKELERLNKHLATRLAAKSGKSEDEILAMMEEETWLYGQEIVDAGFADRMVETDAQPETTDRENAIKKARETRNAALQRAASARITQESNTGDAGEKIERREAMDKAEMLKRLNAMAANGEMKLSEIAEGLGIEMMTPEVKQTVNALKELKVDDPVAEIKNLRQKVEEGETAKCENALTQAFGPSKNDDGTPNLVRQYAEKFNAVDPEKIKEDPIMQHLMAQRADYRKNEIGVVDGGTPPDDSDNQPTGNRVDKV